MRFLFAVSANSRSASGSIHVVTKLARFITGIAVQIHLVAHQLIRHRGRQSLGRDVVLRNRPGKAWQEHRPAP